MQLPQGTVTYLFTDIQGSTELWQQSPETMPHALEIHHSLLRDSISNHGGYVFQIIGDAFCAAFDAAIDAVKAAVDAQRNLLREEWGISSPIRVRMALHSGTAEVHTGEYTSGEYASNLVLSQAARFLAAGHGGQILLSQSTYGLILNDLPEAVTVQFLGEHYLKDLQKPEPIYQIIVQDLPSRFKPLKTLTALPNNLPIQTSSFVGRERELADILSLLKPALTRDITSSPRLLTLVGPGGSGKTRLSLEIGSRLLESFKDGVWFIELVPLRNGDHLPNTVAAAIQAKEKPSQNVLTAVVDHLQNKRSLLILDNCEHIIDACARLADELLRKCPTIVILANSREGLGIAGEVIYDVPPLTLPEVLQDGFDLNDLNSIDSYCLFVNRAKVVQPKLQLTSEQMQAIVKICHELDGNPLAIEMAAARTKLLSPVQIANRLDDRFRLLSNVGRLTHARQRTLDSLIDWSYELLNEKERKLFKRLAVFSGGWSLDAAEAICSDVHTGQDLPSQAMISKGDIVDLLYSLVSKSMVVTDVSRHGDNRFRLLGIIQLYAHEKLIESGELTAIRDRHLNFYTELAETTGPYLETMDQANLMKMLDKESDNIRAALDWSCHPDRHEFGLQLAQALRVFWYTRGKLSEGRDWTERLLTHADGPNRKRARALDQIGFLARYQADFQSAREFITESLAIWRKLQDKKGQADSLANLGFVTLFQGDQEAATSLYQESLELNRQLDNQQGIADALSHLGIIALSDGELELAYSMHDEALEIWRISGDITGMSFAKSYLACVAFQLGQLDAAHRLAMESLQTALQLKYSEGIAWTLSILAAYAARENKHLDAIYLEYLVDSYRQRIGIPASWIQQGVLDIWLTLAYEHLSDSEIDRVRKLAEGVQAETLAAQLLDGQPLLIHESD